MKPAARYGFFFYYDCPNTALPAARMKGFENNPVGGTDSSRKEPAPVSREVGFTETL